MKKLFYTILSTSFFLLYNSHLPSYSIPYPKLLPTILITPETKPSIAVLPFKAPNATYSDAITNTMTAALVQANRLKVADRKNLDKVLKEIAFQQTALVDADTAVQIGKLAGVSYILTGQFGNPASRFNEAVYREVNKKKQKVSDPYYSASVEVSYEIIQVATGLVISTGKFSGYGSDPKSEQRAVTNALQNVTSHTPSGVLRDFKIKGAVTLVNKSTVEMNVGSYIGAYQGMDFEISDPKDSKKKLGVVRLSKVGEKSSEGKVISESSQITVGATALESQVSHAVEAKIIKRDLTEIVITVGKDVGVYQGKVYSVYTKSDNYTDSETGETYAGEDKEHGTVLIEKVADNSARARIIRGIYTIQEGMFVRESRGNLLNGIMAKPSFMINPTNGMSMARLGVGKLDIVNSLSYDLGLNIVTSGVSKVGIGGLDLTGSYEFPIIPEFLFLAPSLGGGLALGSQHSSAISNKSVSKIALQLYPKLTARLELNKFNLFGEVGYMLLNFDSNGWSYSVGEGESARSVEVPPSSLDVASINLSGIYIGGGLSYVF